ncbi:type I-B CRISPR-associated endonuclease Cas1 [Hazenella sp. IB182357]|uniref:CRISPR-associated endonuclease Cas1 n=1 Tax=Polycladospora coralii TaxID=2771432 RepID=A0A926N7P7_9BACL|nr:type I-B CRISPR-associated endonuclease Cas1b [Polycladospora coralii]MBD1373496.1 type I-B CRISPR-associated endonuclease Cas1 [Polycladospora coralii]
MKKTLYLFSHGELRRKDNSLFFENGEGQRKFIPVEDTNDIYLFGEVDVSKRFLEFVSQKEICLHYFNRNGYYMGTFYPREHLNAGHVIVKQVQHYMDKKKRIVLARQFINGSIGQMIRVLKYYQSRTVDGKEIISPLIQQMTVEAKLLYEKENVEELMAVEGHARECYYGAFDTIIANSDFPFEKRSKRPPLNRLNALISFGNAICYTVVLSEIYKTYLDPRIGYLHTTNFRRFSLNLDIAEIFKPILIDRLLFTLINKKMIQKKDFDKHMNGILLSESGRKTFITELDKRLKTTVQHRHLGKSVSYRRLIRLENYKIQKHILDEKEYEPYQALW